MEAKENDEIIEKKRRGEGKMRIGKQKQKGRRNEGKQ